MKRTEIEEGLGELADIAERDHEVQMARAQLYKIAKYSIKLHDMLKGVSEAEGLEGWIQSKITKSSEMIGSVYHHLDYEQVAPMAESQKDTHCSDECCGKEVMREDCKCPPDCEHCNCNNDSIPENVEEGWKKDAALGALGGAALGALAVPGMVPASAAMAAKMAALKGMTAAGAGSGALGGAMGGALRRRDQKKAKLAKAKKDKEAKKEQTYKDTLHAKLEGKFKSAAHRKAVHAGKASGKRKK